MPRTKQSIGRKYGLALAKRYLATAQGDAETAKKLLQQRDRLEAEINSLAVAHELTEADLEEINGYIAAMETMEAFKMAFAAFSMQAVAYAMKAGRNLDIVRDTEKMHTTVIGRPLQIFGGDEGQLLDAEGNPIPLGAYVDLAQIDAAEDADGFVAALQQNDVSGRFFYHGAVMAVDDGRPEPKEATKIKQQIIDRGGFISYGGLFEIEAPTLKDFISESRTQLVRSLYYVDYYLFAAEVLEAFYNLDGLAEVIAPKDILDTTAVAGHETYNIAVQGINEDLILRFQPGEDPAAAGRAYVTAMLEKAREEWLIPVAWETQSHTKEAKAAARELTAVELSTVGRFAAFINAQRKKRGLE